MTKNVFFSLPHWLTIDSIKKFYDPIQLFGFIIPTVGFYCDRVPKTLPKIEFFLIILIIFTFFFLINIRTKYNENEQSIAEALETGYFNNFLNKTALYISEKKRENQPIKFAFKDKNEKTVEVEANQIKVKVILPLSLNSLNDTIKDIQNNAEKGNIDNGAWVFAKNLNGNITIYEYPQTLTTIDQYLPRNYKYNDEKSKYFHKLFKDKFDEDWRKAVNNIPSDIFTISNKFEE